MALFTNRGPSEMYISALLADLASPNNLLTNHDRSMDTDYPYRRRTHWEDEQEPSTADRRRRSPPHEIQEQQEDDAMCFGLTSSTYEPPNVISRGRSPPSPPTRRDFYDSRTHPFTYPTLTSTLGSGRIFTDRINHPIPGREHENLNIRHPLKGQDCWPLRAEVVMGILAQLYLIRARREMNLELLEGDREDRARSVSIEVLERWLEREGWRRTTGEGVDVEQMGRAD